jgi:hypothetical protein
MSRTYKGLLAVCVVMLLASFVYLGMRVSASAAAQAALDEVLAQAEAKEREATRVEQAAVAATREATTAVIGIDFERRDRDVEKATALFKSLLTFSGHDGYEAARTAAIDAGLPADGQVLSQFMPPSRYETYDDGSVLDEVGDADMTYVGMDTRCVSIDALRYDYVSDVTVSSTSSVGEGTGHVLVLWSADASGSLLDVEAYRSV